MTTIGEGRIVFGRWWIYLDSSRQFVGRNPGDESVVYALGPLVFEHFRPEHHGLALAARAAARAEAERARTVARWQGIRNGLWMTAHVLMTLGPGEDRDDLERRRRQYVRDLYRVKTGEYRARHPERFVPTLDELRIHPPQPEPSTRQNLTTGDTTGDVAEPRDSCPTVGRHRERQADPGPADVPTAANGRRPALTLITKD